MRTQPSRFKKLALPLLLLPLLAVAAEPQEIELHMLPQPNMHQLQSMDMKMQMAMDMLPGAQTTDAERARIEAGKKKLGKGMSMDMKMRARVETSEADAQGVYLLHVRSEGAEMNLKVGGEAKNVALPQSDMEIDALMNTKNSGIDVVRFKSGMKITDPKLQEAVVKGLLKQLSGSMGELEGRRMKVGETAEVPFDFQLPIQHLPQGTQLKASLALTLKSVAHGVAHFDTVVKFEMETAPGADSNHKLKMAMNGSGSGTLDYQLAEHLMERQDMGLTLQMDIETPTGVETKMDIKGQVKMRGERIKD